MPNSGTAIKTQSARAAVVESEPVGGVNPGMTMHTLHVPIKRKSVPRNARYFRGSSRPTSLICPSMPVTIISSALCHREMVRPVDSLRVIRNDPNVIAIIMAQVVTMVSLSLAKPYCQNICWSDVMFTTGAIIVHLLAGCVCSWRLEDV